MTKKTDQTKPIGYYHLSDYEKFRELLKEWKKEGVVLMWWVDKGKKGRSVRVLFRREVDGEMVRGMEWVLKGLAEKCYVTRRGNMRFWFGFGVDF